MDDVAMNASEYVDRVLLAYRKTPTTMGTVRQADRVVAVELHARGVSARVVENALILAAARRLMRAPGAPPLLPVRSLAYFLPVIEEVMAMRISPRYFEYLEHGRNGLKHETGQPQTGLFGAIAAGDACPGGAPAQAFRAPAGHASDRVVRRETGQPSRNPFLFNTE